MPRAAVLPLQVLQFALCEVVTGPEFHSEVFGGYDELNWTVLESVEFMELSALSDSRRSSVTRTGPVAFRLVEDEQRAC